MGSCYLIAIGLAIGIASQRAWFERQAIEHYPPLPSSLLEQIATFEQGQAATIPLGDQPVDLLWYAWMTRDEATARKSILPRELLRQDSERCWQRLRATLLAGDEQQRQRALLFIQRLTEDVTIAAGSHERAVLELQRVLVRARALHDEPLAAAIAQAIDGAHRSRSNH
jgi:hypothetical protein